MIQAYVAPTRSQSGGMYLAYVKPEYRKDYKIRGLEYQTYGIRTMPLWNSKPSVIRIIPGYDKATGEIYRQNVNCTEFADNAPYVDYLSDTFIQASVVSNFGPRKQYFITSYAPGSPESIKFGGNTVIDTFIRNMMYSVKNEAEGKKARFRVTDDMRKWCSRDGVMKFSRPAILMQALVFTRNGINSEDDNHQPLVSEEGDILPLLGVVAIEGRQTIQNFLSALVVPSDANLPLDAVTNNKYGGMAELEGNILFLNNVQDPQTGTNALRPSVQLPGKGWTPTPWPLTEQEVKDWWVPWEDLLQYLNPQEQCELLAQDFGPDTVNYIIGTDPNMNGVEIPEEIRSAGLGRYAGLVAGGQQKQANYGGGGYGQQRSYGQQGGYQAPPAKPAVNMSPRPTVRPQMRPQTPEQVMESAHVSSPKPKSAFNGLRANSAMDMDKLKNAMNGIHGASQGNQANMAKNLLADEDLDDYQDPNMRYSGEPNDDEQEY